ncbi:prepilin-type N-terminal cleavage/methylation domain-containing protein [Nitrospina gracilis]|nr:prepilin-type N-terminal cleavage/methylation domain-containing protein [Nitrospina gracilis]
MRKSMNNEKGFTLIELVMVIVILGILAATAIPKFVDLSTSAETAVADGVTGALASNITMLHAQYLISSTAYDATSVANIDTQGITVSATGTAIATASGDIGSGNTHTWTFVPGSGNAAATLTGPVIS